MKWGSACSAASASLRAFRCRSSMLKHRARLLRMGTGRTRTHQSCTDLSLSSHSGAIELSERGDERRPGMRSRYYSGPTWFTRVDDES